MAKEIAQKMEGKAGLRRSEHDPFREMLGLRDTITGLFDDFFSGRPLLAGLPGFASVKAEGWMPPVSIRDTDEELVVYACVPGVPKDACNLEIKDNALILSGRCAELGPDDEHWVRRELPRGEFYRAFSLPVEIKADQVKASYGNGILEIHMPKSEEAKPKRVQIQ